MWYFALLLFYLSRLLYSPTIFVTAPPHWYCTMGPILPSTKGYITDLPLKKLRGVWIENEGCSAAMTYDRDIRVYAQSGHSHNIQCYYSCYDPLQYVLMFPAGEPGWHGNIPTVGSILDESALLRGLGSYPVDPSQMGSFYDVLQRENAAYNQSKKRYKQGSLGDNTRFTRTNKRSSCRQYYAYKLQQRPGNTSYLLRFGRLLQQYVVDMYIKIESMRLAYFLNNQDEVRVEHYRGVMDSVISGAKRGGGGACSRACICRQHSEVSIDAWFLQVLYSNL
ncbi:hypothetical protein LIER_00774 [Lithospermum erythrorhizon]|uniref:Helitron helicase-like domain-containing protein n=1 Tax=Lithospermum erythrorhizon TaxID=34254 RepID=A0AAV3NJB4_LITER